METFIALCIGIGLSAACGFRLFIPLLGLGLAAKAGYIPLSPGFAWLGSYLALLALSVAVIVELAAYFIPWLDNLLDSIASPLAVIAGTLVTASLVGDISPMYRWSLALIAGGGAAGIIQGGTVAARATSTATTAGSANPIISMVETAGSVVTTILAILVPLLACVLVVILCTVIVRKFGRFLFRRNTGPISPAS